MPNLREIYLALHGAWRFAHFDRAALGWFDGTIDGFWKSFFAAAIVLPGFALVEFVLPIGVTAGTETVGYGARVAANAVAYVYAWMAFPLIMLSVTDAVGKADKYLRYIVAYNWVSVLQFYILLPVILYTQVNAETGGPIYLAVQALMLALSWFVARTALGIAGLAAATIVALDFVLGVVIGQLRIYMLSPF